MTIRLYSSILGSLVTGERRDIRSDCRQLLKDRGFEYRVVGAENIPRHGPLLVTMNHYSREGFFILWAAAAICASMPKSSIWLMTDAWTNRAGGLDHLRTRLTRMVFRRLADIYGLVTTPPMPPAPEEAAERAASIRQLMRKIKDEPEPILCAAPEGMDFPGGVLGTPGPGTGKMLLQAAKMLHQVLPVGVYEKGQILIIHFGKPYTPEIKDQEVDVDTAVSGVIMRKIAELLPGRMRGDFA